MNHEHSLMEPTERMCVKDFLPQSLLISFWLSAKMNWTKYNNYTDVKDLFRYFLKKSD